MDKWDEMVSRVKNGILAEEPEAALSGALEMFADFARTVEQQGADLDRIATALEELVKPIPDTDEEKETPPIHDL